MTDLKWTQSMSVGVPELDDDHKRLVDIINRLSQANQRGDTVEWVFGELEAYAYGHFEREEKRLADANFPDLDAHRGEHRDFINWLGTVRTTYGLEPEAQYHLAETVNDFLKNWLTDHILETDMRYKSYLS